MSDILNLDALLWVIPGICFLFSYNRLRDVESIEFSGWPFVFFIVLIGTCTFLPIKYLLSGQNIVWTIVTSSTIAFLIPFIVKFLFRPFVTKLEDDPNFFMPSNFWSIVYFFYPLENRDKFIKNCIDFEGAPILVTIDDPITIKSGGEKSGGEKSDGEKYMTIQSRVFLGFLVEFPYVAMKDISSQVIRILPLLSGYRYLDIDGNKDCNTKVGIRWLNKYEIHDDSTGVIIPRTKITHLARYDKKVHKDMVFSSN